MKIALLGYGKMGKTVEEIALQRHHNIVFIADLHNAGYQEAELNKADVAIEFSTPQSACGNILKCFSVHLPVVVGATGWYEHYEEVKNKCLSTGNTMFTAANFSIGVNLLFELNLRLAELMKQQENYDVSIKEIHHIHKLDAPSGTAIALAEDIVNNIGRKSAWKLKTDKNAGKKDLLITSVRKDEVPGTHAVCYTSDMDDIELIHTAKNRMGFALGAVLAAEWILGKKGVFGMKNLLEFRK